MALEDAVKTERAAKTARNGINKQVSDTRRKKDQKYGFGGKKRFSKSGDAASTADLRGLSMKKMKHQKKVGQRLGKSRRAKKA